MKNKDKIQSKKKNNGSPLFRRFLFTAMAFLAMIVLSYVFVRDIVKKNLVRNAENVFSLAQNQVESDLNNPKMYLAGFSRTIRTAILRGDDKKRIQECLTDLTSYVHSDSQGFSGFDGLFGYFFMPDGPVFLDDSTINFPIDFNPADSPWYKNTTTNHGIVVETMSYADIVTGENDLIYSICIHDDDDNLLGVVCMRLQIDEIGDRVVKAAIDGSGWGMLISRDFVVLAHPNKSFVGVDARDPGFPPHIYMPQMIEGKNISNGVMRDYRGDKSIAFFRKLSNGWYLGLVTPEGPFYNSLAKLAYILGSLGTIFAVALMLIITRIDREKSKSDRESRHKSAFLANMSHEIRTPMNAIIGMTTIGKTADNIARKDYCFNKIEDASNHLLGVINDILDMSKIEANKLELTPVEFNFEKMLQRVVNVVVFRMDEKHQKFTVHIDRNIPKNLTGDDQRIAQVITNLLGNAVKFTPENGSISLNARFLGEENGNCRLEISVSDTGIGVTKEQQERLFMSFEQAESSTTRKYGGTGLGLAISKNIVELMGGAIWVESHINSGSTFTFTIQVKRGTQINEGLLDSDINLGNLRIMAVDDDREILDYFTEIANGIGITNVATAICGEEALGLVVRNGDYHIYFIDWKMPVMDGIQLAAEIKKRTNGKSVVIMISAAEWTSIETEATKAGVDKFLSKPLFPSDIFNLIMECMSLDRKPVEETHDNIDGIFSGRHVLLVEDVDINREIVQALLEPTQIEIDTAENGAVAVRMFKEAPGKYDVILMDVQMPEMDGYEATSQIRALKNPEAKTVRIVAMTANVFRDDIEKCLEVGMDNHIGKPVDFGELMEKLQVYIQPRREK